MSTDLQRAHADAGAAAAEVIGGIRTVRAFSREQAEADRYERQTARALEFARRKIVSASALGAVSFVAGECAAVLAIWVGGHLIVSGRLTTGALISFILLAVSSPTTQIQLLVWIFAMRIVMVVASGGSYLINEVMAKAQYAQADKMNYEHPLTRLVWLTSIVSIVLTFLLSWILIPQVA